MAPILSRTSGAGGSGGFGFGRKRFVPTTSGITIQSSNASGWTTPNWASGWSGTILGSYSTSNSFDDNTGSLTAFTGTGTWSSSTPGSFPFQHSLFTWAFIQRNGTTGPTMGANNSLTVNTVNWKNFMLNDNNNWWGRMLSGTQSITSPVTAMSLLGNSGDGPDARALFSDGRIIVGSQSNYRITVSDASTISVGDFIQTTDGSKYGYVYAKSGNELDLWKTTGAFAVNDAIRVPTLAQLFNAESGVTFAFSGNNTTTDATGNGNSLVNSNMSTTKFLWRSYTHSFRVAATWETRLQLPTFSPSSSGWSIEFWVHPTSWSGKYLIHCGDGSLSWNVQASEMRFYNNFSTGIATWATTTDNYLNIWNFVQIRYDGINTKFYFNGTERGSLSGNIGSMSQFVIGDKLSNDSFPIDGYIQDVVVYNGVSRAAQTANDTPNTINRRMTPFGLY